MAKRATGFPKELSKPIKWSGPTLAEMADAQSDFPPLRGLLDSFLYEPGTLLSSLTDEQQEPIIQRRKEILAQEEAANEQVRIERFSKLLLLCKHYNIEFDELTNWPLMLCMALANEFFDGMKINFEQRRGRPKKYSAETLMELWAAIEDIKIDRKFNDADACRSYAKRTSQKYSTIQRRLQRARRPSDNPLAKFLQGDPEFHRYMIDVLIAHFGPSDSKNRLSNKELKKKYGAI